MSSDKTGESNLKPDNDKKDNTNTNSGETAKNRKKRARRKRHFGRKAPPLSSLETKRDGPQVDDSAQEPPSLSDNNGETTTTSFAHEDLEVGHGAEPTSTTQTTRPGAVAVPGIGGGSSDMNDHDGERENGSSTSTDQFVQHVVAYAVSEDEPNHVATATAITKPWCTCIGWEIDKKRGLRLGVFIIAAVLIAVGLGVYFGTKSSGGDSEVQKTSTQSPSTSLSSTTAPSASPTAELTCHSSINTEQCDDLLPSFVESSSQLCACYNFCDGQQIGCCSVGTKCSLFCPGVIVSGCQGNVRPPVTVCPDGRTCENLSVCVEFPNDEGTYFCDCEASPLDVQFAGLSCEHQATASCSEESSRSFCTNGGQCKQLVSGNETHMGCICPEGYDGPHCEFAAGVAPESIPP